MTTFDSPAPVPDDDAKAHSARVVAHVRDAIARAGGFIPLARYIELVLYAPGLGYYVAGARKFGAAGDFVTGPELDAAVRRRRRAPARSGARRDVDARHHRARCRQRCARRQLLGELALRDALPVRYRILEVSAELRTRQRASIAAAANTSGVDVEWLDRLPATIEGVVVMNEVLDAVAPRVIARRDGAWFERGVAWQTRRAAGGGTPARRCTRSRDRRQAFSRGRRLRE